MADGGWSRAGKHFKSRGGLLFSGILPALTDFKHPVHLLRLAVVLAVLFTVAAPAQDYPGLPPENLLALPAVGQQSLQVLAPTVLELQLVTTKTPKAPPAEWNFVSPDGHLTLPPAGAFSVQADGRAITVQNVGFKRRVLYAPLKHRDVRIGNWLYLELAAPVPDGAALRVTFGERTFTATADPLRWNPALHANQIGYDLALPKQARLGDYLGSLGELAVPTNGPFTLVDAATGATVFTGTLAPSPDDGWRYAVRPYLRVAVADFSACTTPGTYRVQVPGYGASLPFHLGDEAAAGLARTYALGLYHQRCGTALELPFTRYTHDACHTNLAEIPTPGFSRVEQILGRLNNAGSRPAGQTAPVLTNLESSLFPFVNAGRMDVSQGHHDAGDYSKYTIDSAGFIHFLTFAADAFPGAGALDNLGLPESGDGKSDLLQLAKWEADFLAKLQDADGGFYFLVYPKNRKYEDDVTPDHGDPQVVYPKNTAATAAAIAALAQLSSSPLFQKQFPDAAVRYRAQALKGWGFLQRAWARYGRAGAYQKITQYGDLFADRDEVAWAAAELYLATGKESFQRQLVSEFDPASRDTRHWTWVRLSESYGNAIRSYAFAERTGRAAGKTLDPGFLAKCRAEVLAAAADACLRSRASAYGVSFPIENKHFLSAGWFFPIPAAFDLFVGDQLSPHPEWRAALAANIDYEAGANPVNVTYLTGCGWRRQHESVSQFGENDGRSLPPDGLPLGSIQSGFMYLNLYGRELGALTFPGDGDKANPYPFYDRWADTFNTSTECESLWQAEGLAWLAGLMAETPQHTQPWRAAPAQITGVFATVSAGSALTAQLTVPGLDPQDAQIVWEVGGTDPHFGRQFTFTPAKSGWLEAEALWPDGRRAFARTDFTVR